MSNKYIRPLVLAAAVVSVLSLGCEPDKSITAPGERQPPMELSGSFRGTYVELAWKPTLPGKETTYEIFRSINEAWYYKKIGEVEYADREDKYKYIDVKFEKDSYNFYKVRTAYDGNPGEFSNQVVVPTNTFWLWNAGRFSCKVYKINPVSGSVKTSFQTPFRGTGSDREPSGLTWDGKKYFWHAEMISDRIYNTTAKGRIRLFFKVPNDSPWGLAWDGTYLWNADSKQHSIYRLNPDDWGRVLGSFASPGNDPRGLTWDGTYLWNADFGDRNIYKVDPQSGSVEASFSAPGEAPTGLAWDGTYLWSADKNSRTIYKITPDRGKVVASFPSPDYGPQGLAVEHRFFGGLIP